MKVRFDIFLWLIENENSKNVVYYFLFYLCDFILVWVYSRYYIYEKLMYSFVYKILKRLYFYIYYEYNF